MFSGSRYVARERFGGFASGVPARMDFYYLQSSSGLKTIRLGFGGYVAAGIDTLKSHGWDGPKPTQRAPREERSVFSVANPSLS
jgi:hypothetical protein